MHNFINISEIDISFGISRLNDNKANLKIAMQDYEECDSELLFVIFNHFLFLQDRRINMK
jgi:hypothetical protein